MAEQMDKDARRILDLIEKSVAKRASWATQNVKYTRMYNNDQWDSSELEYLEENKRFPLTINICAPIIDGFVSMLAADSPRFKAIPSTNRYVRLSQVADFTLEYIAYISHFPQEFVATMNDYAIAGIGWMMPDVDPTMDYGAGEVINRHIPWPDVHWDWRARRPGLADREWTGIYKQISGAKLKQMFPKKIPTINAALKMNFSKWIDDRRSIMTSSSAESPIHLIGDIEMDHNYFEGDQRELPVIEMYELVYRKVWSVFDPAKNVEEFLEEAEFRKRMYPKSVRDDSFEVTIPRVKKTVTIAGYRTLDVSILKVSNLPPTPFVKLSTGSAYPMGIMPRLEDVQNEQNRRRMAIIENAMASAAGRLLAPRGAIDRDEWNIYSRLPGGLVEYKRGMDLEKEAFIQLTPQSLPNQLFYLDQTAIQLAEYISGVDSLFLGSTRNLPETYRQSLMIEDYGTRKIRAIDLSNIDTSLETLGQTTLEMAQNWYDYQKTLSIVDDEGALRQVVLNQQDIDPASGVSRGAINDLRATKFQVRVISGSTMPKNRYAILELYLGLFDRGLIDETTVLKQTDVVDIDTVLERVSKVRLAMQTIDDMSDQMKQQEAIINSLQRQLIQAKIKTDSQEYLMMMELAALQRQMQERLSKALVDLSARNFVDNMKREEKYLSQIANLQVKNLVDISRANIRTAEEAAKRTGPSQ